MRRSFTLLQPRRLERDADEEMLFHIEMWKQEFRAHGMSDADAEAAAWRRFGDSREYREYAARRAASPLGAHGRLVRRVGAGRSLRVTTFSEDARLHRHRVLTLALGIGANTRSSASFTECSCAASYPNGDRIVSLRVKGLKRQLRQARE